MDPNKLHFVGMSCFLGGSNHQIIQNFWLYPCWDCQNQVHIVNMRFLWKIIETTLESVFSIHTEKGIEKGGEGQERVIYDICYGVRF